MAVTFSPRAALDGALSAFLLPLIVFSTVIGVYLCFSDVDTAISGSRLVVFLLFLLFITLFTFSHAYEELENRFKVGCSLLFFGLMVKILFSRRSVSTRFFPEFSLFASGFGLWLQKRSNVRAIFHGSSTLYPS